MNPKDIETLSKKSAHKYRNTSHHEDLVSEGILAAYEEINVNPSAPEQRLYQVISTAQWKFLNVDCLPVTIPFQLVRVAKGLGYPEDKQGFSDSTISWAKLICETPQFDSSYYDEDEESDQVEAYERQDLVKAMWYASRECLGEEEYDLFHAYFNQEKNGEVLGQEIGVTRQTINYHIKRMCERVRKHIVNKKWEL